MCAAIKTFLPPLPTRHIRLPKPSHPSLIGQILNLFADQITYAMLVTGGTPRFPQVSWSNQSPCAPQSSSAWCTIVTRIVFPIDSRFANLGIGGHSGRIRFKVWPTRLQTHGQAIARVHGDHGLGHDIDPFDQGQSASLGDCCQQQIGFHCGEALADAYSRSAAKRKVCILGDIVNAAIVPTFRDELVRFLPNVRVTMYTIYQDLRLCAF